MRGRLLDSNADHDQCGEGEVAARWSKSACVDLCWCSMWEAVGEGLKLQSCVCSSCRGTGTTELGGIQSVEMDACMT